MFNWAYAASGRDAHLAALRAQLRKEMPLKSGTLYHCPECRQRWYLDRTNVMATRVPREREALLHEWSSQVLSLGTAFVHVLASIGSIEADRYGNGRGYGHVPCAIRWADGILSDPCIVLVTDLPPILPTQRIVKLFRHVTELRPTEFALPLEVRCATRAANELRMGFAPTAVKDPTGRVLLINGSADVFEYDGIRGKDIRLTIRRWSIDKLPPVVSDLYDRITFVYADSGPYEQLLTAICR